MAVSYNKLFHLMVDQKLSNTQLADRAGISLNIVTRLKRDEYVSMETVEKICGALDCGVDEILEFVQDIGHNK
ncbi:MAG: helix-turn-helix transcriptional regulator [Vescimonas sp.]|uniref:helix-turn-helix domain-containing protein n=1 Tax=Vescimonas sp. TaxID=2892404 RepID=UPI002A91BBE0|nr:helix-turn-helix transcriptional regulator [Vescimonas sp.]MDY5333968.1 helix-turn-helix transcriptional regulator [Vescimonas sp.]